MKFEKVSFEQYRKDVIGKQAFANSEELLKEYEDIAIPTRATKCSAGYDFKAPFDFQLNAGEYITIATGIKCKLDDDKVLIISPRSGLGFKYGVRLANTIGVVDANVA